MRVSELLLELENMQRKAETGQAVYAREFVTNASRDWSQAHALVRILFMLMAVKGVSADDLAEMRQQYKSASDQRRRPLRAPRGPGERRSPRLW